MSHLIMPASQDAMEKQWAYWFYKEAVIGRGEKEGIEPVLEQGQGVNSMDGRGKGVSHFSWGVNSFGNI